MKVKGFVKNEGRCSDCDSASVVSASNWSFIGYRHEPYKGKWVSEIKVCPKDMDKAKPIIFSTPMVHTILDGRKTMTRRVIKPQPERYLSKDARNRVPMAVWVDNEKWVKSPYQPGDILWVRETWCRVGEDVKPIHLNLEQIHFGQILYKADGFDISGIGKWRPSIFMPKEAARIFLRITGVRAERVQDITAHDAIREGMESEIPFDTVDEFKELWNNLNAKRGYSWESNPWVWVISFERVSADATEE
jgi:hypothetical protein